MQTETSPAGVAADNSTPAKESPGSAAISATAPGQLRVIKRNGTVVPFEGSKISVAITKAFLAVEGGTAAALTAAGGLAEGHPGDETHVLGGAEAQDEPVQRPVDDSDTVAVARSEDEVGVGGCGQEPGDVVGVVREIAVHLEDELVVAFEGPKESGAIGTAEAVLGSEDGQEVIDQIRSRVGASLLQVASADGTATLSGCRASASAG